MAIIALSAKAQSAFAGDLDAYVYYGGSYDGYATAAGANADAATISSAAAQTFTTGDSATAISAITVTLDVGQTGSGINTTNHIRVVIPASLDMAWDTTDTTATFGGSASAKVSNPVSYPNSKTLLINVTTNFANGDTLTVADLSFKNFNSVGLSSLTLSIDGGTTTAATDDKKKTISLPASTVTFTGGSYDGYTLGTNIRYWVASADGNWNDTANWSDTSAGTSGFSVPTSGEVAVFDSGSTKQCTVNLAAVSLLDLIMTSAYTGANAKIISNGNLTLAGALNITGGTLDISTNANTLTTAGTLTIDGGTLTATNGNIDANGAVTLTSGTLTAPATGKSFTVFGNWTKSGGIFTSGTGTVTFDAGSGTQQVTSGGVTDNDDFYDITHSGAGTLQLQDAMVVKHDLTNSAGIWDANGKAITIYENFANTATFTHNNNSVTFRGTAQSDITGNNTFYNLTIDTNTDGAKAVHFGASQTQTIAGALTFTGYAGKLLTLRSNLDGTQGTLNPAASITSGVDYLDIKDSKVNGSNHTITAGAHSVDSGNNTNWIFGGGTARTITGSLYQSNRSTKLTNQTVKLSVNGASVVQQVASSGDFTFNNILLSSGDKILAWIDDDATYEGNTITVSDGNNLTGFNIYAGHVTVRYETGSSITNANLSTAKGALTDDDIKYSVTGANLTVQDNFKFFIPATYTHAPTGTVTLDDIEIGGIFNANSNDVTVSGDWDNAAGSYISGNNTTTFNGVTKQTLTSGGTGDTKDFYNLTHSGSAELELAASNALDVDGILTQSGAGDFDTQGINVTSGGLTVSSGTFNNDARAGTWDVNGAVSISSGTLTATSGAFTVSGAWNKTGGTFTHNSGTVTFDGTSAQSINSGGSNFSTLVVTNASDYLTFSAATSCANFTAQTASSKIKFKESANFTVSGTLTLNGQAAGTEIELISAASGTQWNLVAPVSTVNYVKVKDSNATNTITANNAIDLGNNNTNWVFGTVTRYWLGTASVNWNDTANWSATSGGAGGADVPSTGDTAIFNASGNNPCTVNIATVSLATLNIQSGYTFKLDANANDITVSGNATVAGGELELDSSSQLTVEGTLTVSGGTLDGLSGTIDANGNVTVSGGELVAPSGNFNIAGNFSRTSGIFTHSSGTVVFDGAGAATIFGDTAFWNFSCTTLGKQINFTAGTNQTVNHTLTLTGGSGTGEKISLYSTASGAKWGITLAGANQTASYIDVKDADANTHTVACYNSANSGNNNANWIFNTIAISSPTEGKTTGRIPVVQGTAGPNDTITIKDSGGSTVVTATADASGNFRVTLSAELAQGANSLTPYFGAIPGTTINLTAVSNPTTAQVPTITSPAEGVSIKGNKPSISGKGKPGASVTLTAKDANGNLLLSNVASGTVNASGDYTITSSDYTTALVKGINYLSVTVDGVTSSIREISFVDPFGVVFDAVSNNPVQGAVVTIYTSAGVQCVPGVQIAATDSNPQTTGADGVYGFLTINGDFYFTVSASGYAYPSAKTSFSSGRTIVTGSKGEVFSVAGAVIEMDHPVDSNGLLLKVNKDANKKEVTVGDIVTYTVTIQNPTSSDVTGVYLEDKIPAGFKYISGKVILDNLAISDPAGNRPLTFSIGTITAGQTRTLKYQLVVGSGVSFGNYANTAFAKYADGTVISNQASKTVKVVPDPLFDLGTVIGKVFWDRNENGIQDQGEEPIPNVQVATEEGTLITTDKDGKYHLPAIIPGRHLFRLDERTLPQGAYLTTDKVVIVDITSGILAKVNFGINGQDEGQVTKAGGKGGEVRGRVAPVNITQDRNRPVPRLNVSLLKEGLIIKEGKLIDGRCEFRIFTNYSLFIDKWKLEILDRDTKALVRAFEGSALDIHQPIYWDGKDKYGKLLNKERRYAYMLSVTDKSNRIDMTKERPLTINDQGTATTQTEQDLKKEKEKWLDLGSKVNNLDRQNIKIDGETILVHSVWQPTASSIRVMKNEKIAGEISVAQPQQSSPSEVLAEPQKLEETRAGAATDIILPKGEYDIQIVPPVNEEIEVSSLRGEIATKPALPVGRQSKEEIVSVAPAELPRNDTQLVYSQHIKIGEDYLFFVGMGDAKAGYNFNRGNIEPAGSSDKFKEGFWSEGKLAYYLKGKIKGKYLITSSLDTDRNKKELFRNLDPNKYYPVYGDSSSINYAATNTQGPFYLLVEWDKSSALWGDYNTNITDTEFAQFNRSLYGGKIYYEDVATTQFGEPKTKLVVFRAHAKQKAAHNEFVGTGGSLYYLKNKDAVEGSEKIKIEVRDKITGLALTSKEMQEGSDYEIDYTNGRIIFWRPVAQIVESESIISSSLLGGNPVYVVADYEYEVDDKYDQGTQGGRIQQSLTDYLRVGGTYVKEEQLDKNYELKGADTILHLGKNIKLTGEYAETQSEALGSFVSTDGGISFTEMATADSDKGKAYGLKAEAYLLGKLGLSGYYKQIEKGFSSAATTAQKGKELMGAQATLDITPKTRLSVTHDIQKLIDDGNPQTQLQVGAQKTETTTAQITHEATQKLKFTGEYRRQQVTGKKDQFESETNTESNVAALKADYQATKKTALSLEQQISLSGTPNQQTTLGVVHKPNEWLSLRGKETVGNQGTATGVGASANLKDKFELSSDYTKASYKGGGAGDTVSLGGRAMVDDKTEVHTTYAVTDSSLDGKTESVVYGSKRKVNDELDLKTDRTYARSKDALTEGSTYGLVREKDGRKLEGDWTKQRSQSSAEASDTNIFGLSGDINDKWAAQGSFERGKVQNFDGTQAERNAGSFGLGFVDTDKQTGETKLKASIKLELRLDNGEADKRQYLVYNAIEGKINPNTTLFAKANLSQTKNTTTNSTEAQYKELVTGVAYRPVNFDRLNLLARYTYLENNAPSGQSDISSIEREKSHILAGEAVYDLTDKWQFVEKLALKFGEEKVSGFEFTKTQTWLMIQRINYNINRDWQVGGEYRRLTQKQAKDYNQGVLVEVARKVGEFLQVGVGYNFTNFNDDLTHLDYTSRGPFFRITGKFYDRTPEEIERARQKWLERMIKQWAGELVNQELANPHSPVMQELYKYFYTAEKLRAEGRLKESGALYEKILQIGNIMYQEAEVYVRDRIELEKALKENDRLARLYYKEGKLEEAKALWQKIIKEAEPVPIYLKF
ncbi:MAG: hypothetical protein COY78_04470 [Candidatus Omnitrophica bacterium CG_4_10_14_0_8_um_filter_44_12]|nr:MAG: hypothetical protein COY78_04470 [Candidatus Omnitrophica bacterium CG_4_10_14_0_8_um_filter_44_12]